MDPEAGGKRSPEQVAALVLRPHRPQEGAGVGLLGWGGRYQGVRTAPPARAGKQLSEGNLPQKSKTERDVR